MRSRKNDYDQEEQELLSRVQLPDCPDMCLLSSAHEGVLPEEQAGVIGAHLEKCEICRTLFQDLESIELGVPTTIESERIRARITRQAPRAFQPANSPSAWIRKRWWVPAMAVATAALIAVVLLKLPKGEPQASTAQIAQAKPLPEVPLEKLAIHVDPSALLATRGPGNAAQPSGSELVKALTLYKKDDYTRAAEQLKALAKKYPKDGTVHLYLGVSELFLNDINAAANDLAAAKNLNDGARLADSKWYLAIAGLRLKQPEVARAEMHELCEGKNTYTEHACEIESQLK